MSEINWGLLQAGMPTVANPIDVLRAATADRDAQAQTNLKQQAFAAQQAQAARQAAAQQSAGAAYQAGDVRGANAALIGSGQNDLLSTVNTTTKQDFDQHTDGLKAVGGFANYVQQHIGDPTQRAAVIAHNKPLLVAAGAHPDDVDAIAADPSDAALGAVAHQYYDPKDQDAAAVAQQNANSTTANANINQQNADTERYRAQVDAGHPVFGSEGQTPYFNQVAPPSGPIDAATLYQRAIKPMESGGEPFGGAGAIGQATRFGTAQGSSQMLPATAQSMAAKLGIAWHPELMTAHTPQALQYQDQLGTAYAQTALDASGGDAGKALAYYYGGPNLSLHGPKTASYVQNGLSRLGLGGGSNGVVNTVAGAQLAPKAQPGSTVVAPGNPSLAGPAYMADLAKQNPSLAARVQAVLDTRAPYPRATGSRNPADAQIAAALYQVDPSFDQAAYKRRQDTISAFGPKGAQGQALISAATIINHLYTMAQASEKLPDHYTNIQNRLSNGISGELNNPDLIAVRNGVLFNSTEIPKFLSGKPPTEGEINAFRQAHDPSLGASGMKKAISTDLEYIYGRFGPLLQTYRDQTGKDFDLSTLVPGVDVSARLHALQNWQQGGGLQEPKHSTAPAQARSSAPAAAQAYLKANPHFRAAYEAKYGAGSASAVLGG